MTHRTHAVCRSLAIVALMAVAQGCIKPRVEHPSRANLHPDTSNLKPPPVPPPLPPPTAQSDGADGGAAIVIGGGRSQAGDVVLDATIGEPSTPFRQIAGNIVMASGIQTVINPPTKK